MVTCPGIRPRWRLRAAREPEVPAEEEDCVEGAEALVDLGQREQADVTDSPAGTDLDGARRDVDGHRFESLCLRSEAVPAGARTDVEHASFDVLENRPLRLGPVVVAREEPRGAHGRPDVPVVALELRLP